MSEGYPGLTALWEEEKLRRQALEMDTSLSPPPSPGLQGRMAVAREGGVHHVISPLSCSDRCLEGYRGSEGRLQDQLEVIVEDRLQAR